MPLRHHVHIRFRHRMIRGQSVVMNPAQHRRDGVYATRKATSTSSRREQRLRIRAAVPRRARGLTGHSGAAARRSLGPGRLRQQHRAVRNTDHPTATAPPRSSTAWPSTCDGGAAEVDRPAVRSRRPPCEGRQTGRPITTAPLRRSTARPTDCDGAIAEVDGSAVRVRRHPGRDRQASRLVKTALLRSSTNRPSKRDGPPAEVERPTVRSRRHSRGGR
jgi:hypothetical protein